MTCRVEHGDTNRSDTRPQADAGTCHTLSEDREEPRWTTVYVEKHDHVGSPNEGVQAAIHVSSIECRDETLGLDVSYHIMQKQS